MIMGMCIGCSPYNAEQSVITQAIAVLRRFGTDAHIYLPGVGMLNGLQAGNFIHSNGTGPGEVDQPVGLVLDAAGGLGVELVAFPYVARGTVSGTTQFTLTTTSVATTEFGVVVALPLLVAVAGKSYRITSRIVSKSVVDPNQALTAYTSASQNSGVGAQMHILTAGGHSSVYAPASTSTITVRTEGGTATIGDSWVIEFSVREVTGIHASQTTTSAKPILRRGAVNLLTYSGDFSNAVWTKVGGAFTGQTFTEDASTGGHLVVRYGMWSTSQQTAAYRVKHVPGRIVGIGNNSVAIGVFFDLSSGAVAGSYGAITGTVTQDTDGYYIVTATHTAAGAQTLGLMLAQSYTGTWNTTSNYTGDGVSSLTVTHGGLFQGTYTAQQIQALGGIPLTTTAPASTALGPQYWSFDGSNDSLSLGSVPWTATDDHCVIAGVRTDVGGLERYFFGVSGASAANPLFPVLAWGSANIIKVYWRNDAGSLVQAGHLASALTVGTAYVASAVKRSDDKTLRLNGVLRAGQATGATGAATLTNARIGSLANSAGADVGFFTGLIYPVIAIKGTVTDADLLLLEKLVASMSGVTI